MVIINGRVINPSNNMDGIYNIYISGDTIAEISNRVPDLPDDMYNQEEVIDAKGMLVFPGLIDMHVHFRDPGQTYKEDLKTGAAAAAKGGFTSVCTMPNTAPVIDSVEAVRDITDRSRELPVNILPVAAITYGLEGKELTDMKALAAAGAIAFSDDGKSVMDAALYREALINAKKYNTLIMAHCEDKALVKNGVMNEGKRSVQLGMPGISNSVEDVITARDLLLAVEIGCRLHLCHCSTSMSVRMKRLFIGTDISAETCPHYFTLCDEDIPCDNADFKMNPPLRSETDMLAIKNAVSDNSIDVISTDHAPHSAEEKSKSMLNAPFGITGLETSVSLVITELVNKGLISYMKMAQLMSYNPAKILKIDKGSIETGKIADITIINPEEEYIIDRNTFVSKGHNTPFDGKKVKGRVRYTIKAGNIVYKSEVFTGMA